MTRRPLPGWRREPWYRAAIRLGHLLLDGLDVRVHVAGLEHLPPDGPVVLAANHVSYPDFLLLQRGVLDSGRLVRFLCRYDMWTPLTRPALDGMGHVPVDRAAPAGAYVEARARLRAGEVVGLFPEAGISTSYAVRGLMPGAAALAVETGAPLVPAVLWGGQRLGPAGHLPDGRHVRPEIGRGRRVDVVLGAPLRPGRDEDPRVVTAALGGRLAAMLTAVQQHPAHQPRPGEWAWWHPAHLGGAAPDTVRARELDDLPRSAVAPTWAPWVD